MKSSFAFVIFMTWGAENAGPENAGLENSRSRDGGGKCGTGKCRTKIAGVENAGPENEGPRRIWKMKNHEVTERGLCKMSGHQQSNW